MDGCTIARHVRQVTYRPEYVTSITASKASPTQIRPYLMRAFVSLFHRNLPFTTKIPAKAIVESTWVLQVTHRNGPTASVLHMVTRKAMYAMIPATHLCQLHRFRQVATQNQSPIRNLVKNGAVDMIIPTISQPSLTRSMMGIGQL